MILRQCIQLRAIDLHIQQLPPAEIQADSSARCQCDGAKVRTDRSLIAHLSAQQRH